MGGRTNLGRDDSGEWALFEHYSRGRYEKRSTVGQEMLEPAMHRSFAEFDGPWSMRSIGEEMISGGYMVELFREGSHGDLRSRYDHYRDDG